MMKDIVHHLFGLQGLVVKDEGNATTHHLQPTSAVKHGATLTHNGHWDRKREQERKESLQVKIKAVANIWAFFHMLTIYFADTSYVKPVIEGKI